MREYSVRLLTEIIDRNGFMDMDTGEVEDFCTNVLQVKPNSKLQIRNNSPS